MGRGAFVLIPALEIAVDLSSESLDAIPLSERCLTAKVVRNVPRFARINSFRLNDVDTSCLGSGKRLFDGDEFALFDFYPCVGDTFYPCDDAGELGLFVTTGLGVGGAASPQNLFQPEKTFFHVGVNERATLEGVEYWSTASRFDMGISLLRLFSSAWDDTRIGFATTGIDGRDPPGSIKLHLPEISTPLTWDIADFTFPSSIGTDTFYEIDLYFGALGTYVSTVNIRATHSGTPYTDSATYTFHVGPISELEVRGGGSSPLAATGQRAYTVMAANNGPDAAPAVVVSLSGVPRGAQAVISSGGAGVYRQGRCDSNGLCDATWTLGKMPVLGSSLGWPHGVPHAHAHSAAWRARFHRG